ncbi:MAG: 30S ribosomal protein S6 [Pirellulaceae bacterium]|nr:MAG: 30S ribosomal protein S6 [Pirellulaceae bacterium]
MAVNVYECLFILDPNRYAREPHKVASTIPAMIEKSGGEVMVSRLWNEQKLAYPIEGHRKGTYWLAYFRMDSQRVAEFERECRLNENVLRHLTLKVDPRLVDILIQHARGEKPLRPGPATAGQPLPEIDDTADEEELDESPDEGDEEEGSDED